MAEKVESELSYSGESSSTSETSSGSSEGDDESLEPVRILGHSLELPQELCEDYSLFKEFFSMKTWEALEDNHKEELTKLLPTFTENDEEEKNNTLKMLFNHEPFHFTSPLGDFYDNLSQGNYRPDIAKMRKFLKKARAKQQKHKIKSYYAKLLPEVLISRERVLAAAKAAPPGPIPRLPLIPPKPSSKNNYKPLYLRAKQRYFEELNAIRSEVGGDESDDDNYPEGPPEQSIRNQKQNTDRNVSGTLGGSDQPHLSSLQCLKNVLATHRSRRQYRENHPELNTIGITLDDIKQRVFLVNGAKKVMFGSQKHGPSIQKLRRGSKKDTQKHAKGQESKVPNKKGKEELIDSVENRPLLPNIKIKCEQEESDSESSSFVDPITSPKSSKKFDHVEIKQEVTDIKYPNSNTNENYNDPKLDCIVKQEPQDSLMALQNSSRLIQPVPIKLEDLDGIDMMALPVEIADDSGEVVPVEKSPEAEVAAVGPDESLTETTHANFLSLVRALFPARAAHRASKQQLHARCKAVIKSPIAPLNTWYHLSDDWCSELVSALDFLAGERGSHPDDFVPYLQYMPETKMYQWIGAGRDCDAILGRLCERWLRSVSPPPPPRETPPPRYPTTWSVRPPTEAELVEFRAQERRRFSSAVKPFTYKQHGYRAVVGPCGRGACGGASAVLAASRPRHAALPALVRDAVARLPNGEGTRHHVLTLLKMSQWIAPCSDQTLLSAVSSVLDRLLSAKRDPMVKYDQRTAVWTYLHRHRTEEDWLKITNRGRSSKASLTPSLPQPSPQPQPAASVASAAPPAPPAPHAPPAPPAPPAPAVPAAPAPAKRDPPHTSPHDAMDLEVGSVEEVVENASDSDVDVDDSKTPSSVPNLSSAQLLMQATQTPQVRHIPPAKLKAKQVPTVQRGKYNVTPKIKPPPPKQATLMTQSAKQAQMLAQAVRQSFTQIKQSTITSAKSPVSQSPKQTVTVQPPKQTSVNTTVKPVNVPKQIAVKQTTQIKPISQTKPTQSPKQTAPAKQIIVNPSGNISAQLGQLNVQMSKSLPSVVATPNKSPLIKQRPLQKVEISQAQVPASIVTSQLTIQPPSLIQSTSTTPSQIQNKVTQVTRSLLIRPTVVQTTVTVASTTPSTQAIPTARRGMVRVLSPATPSSGKSLISPRALLQQVSTKKRTTVTSAASVTTIAQSTAGGRTAVVSSVPTAVTSSVSTRSVQLAGGRTVQLPGGQAVTLAAGHTLQLSALQLPPARSRALQPPAVHIPVSSVQLAGQTVQIAGQTVQLTGHTVKLPGGQSVQVAGQSVLPTQSVQLPSGQTVQLASGGMQTVQLGSGVQLSGQSVQMPSGQHVQLSGQTVQLAGQTVQLPSGQTLQLSTGQTVQLTSGQTLQLASGQTVQLGNQMAKSIPQVVRSQTPADKPVSGQPIVAKLLTNAQGQMLSLEGVAGRPAVRVLAPAARLTRPLLLTAAKPLHNIILQQSDGTAIRVTSSGATPSSQTLILGNIGAQAVTTSTTSAPVLKLQQVNPIQQVKLAQGIKIQQAAPSTSTASTSGVRSVLMDGQQLKLVGGRHVLARILRPAHPPQ